MEEQPASMPQAQQAGEAPAYWGRVKPWVWTGRMLAALVWGVKGGKWFPDALAQHPAQALPTARSGARSRPPALAERHLFQTWALQPESSPRVGAPILFEVTERHNHRPESRMRETRTSGSEGGGPQSNAVSLPLSARGPCAR